MSREIGDVAGLPRLLAGLDERCYDEAALSELAHENWRRVLRKTWSAQPRSPSAAFDARPAGLIRVLRRPFGCPLHPQFLRASERDVGIELESLILRC
jgi:hypothetical protein